MDKPYVILHLGLGSFHRAHQAVYLHELIQRGDDDWVLAGGNLILASNIGQGMLLSPQTGAVNGTFDVEPTLVEPVVVNNTLLVLGTDGTLVAYR